MKKIKLKNSEDFREEIGCVEKEANKIYDKAIDAPTFSFEEGEFLLGNLEELNSCLENIKIAINQHNISMNKKLNLYFWLKNILWILAMSMCYVSVPIALIIEIFVIISINKFHNYRRAIIDKKTFESLNQEMTYITNNITTSYGFVKKKTSKNSTEDTISIGQSDLTSTQKLSFEASSLIRQRILY